MQTAKTNGNPPNWTTDSGLATEPFEFGGATPETERTPEMAAGIASIIRLGPGLYVLEIGRAAALSSRISGLLLPAIQVSAPPNGGDAPVEIIGMSDYGEAWLSREGGTIVVKSPPGGGHVLVTTYGLPEQAAAPPYVEVHRLDRRRPVDKGAEGITADDEPDEVRTEFVLHVERLGDRRFPGQGWVGNRDKKLRIEAFSIRPIDTLTARDIEFKALGPNGRHTPWVTDAKLCGTRGRGLPLTGFAIRLAPRIGDRFDVVYHGAFFESGVVGPSCNGELCIPRIADDPLEAMNVRVIRRVAE